MKILRWPILLLSLLVIAGIVSVPILPRIQTRYMTVAWEMWRDHSFLVPTLNGAFYSHKPPLMMWLFHLGWAVFGVSETWARLVAPLFSIGTMALMPSMARRLWPNREDFAELAPVMLIATVIFLIYNTFVMMDSLVTFFAALGWLGLLMAWRDKGIRGWIMFALAAGLGGLTKGPVILLFILPTALLAPLWIVDHKPDWRKWYTHLGLAFAGGLIIALCWVVPAAIDGGKAFANELIFKQTENRISGNLGHPHSWWWYLPFLPFLFFPWAWMPSLWKTIPQGLHKSSGPGARFFLISSFIPLLIFFAINGKQVHYLMPLTVPLALISARALGDLSAPVQQRFAAIINGVLMGISLLVILYGLAAQTDWALLDHMMSWMTDLPQYVQHLTITGGVLMFSVCLWALFWEPRGAKEVARKVAFLVMALGACGFAEASLSIAPFMDVKPEAHVMGRLEKAGKPLAFAQHYYGEFHFSGRLQKNFEIIANPTDQMAWAEAHPDGYIISIFRGDPDDLPGKPYYKHIYKKRWVMIWSASTVLTSGARVLRKQL